MKLKKIAALVLAGVLCLTAFTGCGVNADDTAATLGEQKVSAGIVNFICKYQKASMDDMYIAYFGEDVWEQDLYGSGTTLEDDMKEYVMTSLHDLYTLKAHMDDYGVEITDEEEVAISEAAAAFIEANSDEVIEEFTATEDIVTEVLTLYTIQAKMYDAIIADTDREVSDEEANMRGYSVISIGIDGYYDDSSSYTSYTDEEIASIKATAANMAAALEMTNLEAVADTYGYEVTTSAYAKDDESLDEELLTALDALAEGETSGLIETDSALYFVRIDSDTDEEATEENREAIIAEREEALYDEVLTGWQEEDGWTVDDAVVEKIDFHNILTQTSESTEDSESVDTTEGE